MVRTFIQTREFSRNWDKLGFKDEDLRKLELELLENSDLHPVIKGNRRTSKDQNSFCK